MIQGHGGDIYDLARRIGCDPSEIIDMSSNVNPFGPPAGLVGHLKDNILAINALPEVDAKHTAEAFAVQNGIDPDRVLAGNGTTQFIHSIPHILGARQVLILGPTYADYADGCRMHGIAFDYCLSSEAESFRPDRSAVEAKLPGFDTVYICNPNNPTGVLLPREDLLTLIRRHSHIRFIVDESYLPFTENGDEESVVDIDLPNLLVLHSLSKIFRIPGLRIGFLIAPREMLARFLPYQLPWNVNSLSQSAVHYLMSNRTEIDAFVDSSRRQLVLERERFISDLSVSSEIDVYPSTTSFVLARLSGECRAEDMVEYLSHHGILIRNCSNFEGLSNRFLRFSLKTGNDNRMAVGLLLKKLAQGAERSRNSS